MPCDYSGVNSVRTKIMPDNNTPQNTTQPKPEDKERLLEIFERLIPLIDGISDSIRFAVLLGAGLAIWIFLWIFLLNDYSLTTAGIITGLSAIPALILSRFWWALEELKELPDIVGDMMGDAKEEVKETIQKLHNGDIKKAGLIGSAKSLFSIRSVLSEADDLLGSYISMSALINPLWLILGVFSLISVILLIFISIVLVLFAIF